MLVADEIRSVRNQGQLEVTRPTERGCPTDLATQLRVWRRVCDLEGVGCPLPPDPADAAAVAAALGEDGKGRAATAAKRSLTPPPPAAVGAGQCRALLLSQPHLPRTVGDGVDAVLYGDLGFAVVGKVLAQSAAAARYLARLVPPDGGTVGGGTADDDDRDDGVTDDGTGCCLVIDSGYSVTHVVPTHRARAVLGGVRRLNVGGRMITNLLREWCTYRQWNLMDETALVNAAKEMLCYVVPTPAGYMDEMRRARRVPRGFCPYDREYVLPDFAETFEGTVRLASGLRRERDREEREKEKRERRELKRKMRRGRERDGEQGEAAKADAEREAKKEAAKVRKEERQKKNDGDNGMDGAGGGGEEPDSDEETDEQRLKRVQRMKEEERQRRQAEEESRQAVTLSVERFTAPEVLFRPDDVGLEQGGVAETVVQAIEACPPVLRAALYQNVLLTGGNALMPGYAERLETELRSLAPANYLVRVCRPKDPVTYAWKGAMRIAELVTDDGEGTDEKKCLESEVFGECFVDRVQWQHQRALTQEGRSSSLWSKAEERSMLPEGAAF